MAALSSSRGKIAELIDRLGQLQGWAALFEEGGPLEHYDEAQAVLAAGGQPDVVAMCCRRWPQKSCPRITSALTSCMPLSTTRSKLEGGHV